ncbi:MAG: hypothetical protein BZY75_03465 [SAR202 cluster bacterium Io17-Chloro-G7]|nr:MAG: hypothetical protein BZY75_03465 [SAR202 cluster bacterium Io17-Chloro-G7]
MGQQTFYEEALLDTRFDGALAVPPLLMEGQEPDWLQVWTLADGSQVPSPVYRGIVQLSDFQPMPILVVALGPEWIMGLGILRHFSVTLDHGQRVVVNP